jgi:aromatic-L-amino-acid/L-tryptophan decarboxylase
LEEPADHVEEMRNGALNPTGETIRAMGSRAVDLVADYLDGIGSLRVFPDTSPAVIRAALPSDLPVEGRNLDELLQLVNDVMFAGSRHNGHPRFFGYVASPGTAHGALADMLASALNSNVTSWRSAPAATEVERLCIAWIKQIVGVPPGADGLFVSDGSMANFCGLAAARDALAPVTRQGFAVDGLPMTVYTSDEGHHSVEKAAGLLGLGRDYVRRVPVDGQGRMDVDALVRAVEKDIARGLRPCCVVATLGTVGTGAVDDLPAVAEVAARYGLWLHVDASYGGFAALAPSKRALFRGIERADSVALDPHKWLYVPVDCGCVLYKDSGRARAAFGADAEYTRVMEQDEDEAFAFWDFGPELSRRFRALKVWMTLSHVGTRTLGEAVERNCECARYFEELVNKSEEFEMLAPVPLSIFCFRYVPPSLRPAYEASGQEERARLDHEIDALNERILIRLQRAGSSYLSNARVGGRFALRGCVMNFRTERRDMDILLDDVRSAVRDTAL